MDSKRKSCWPDCPEPEVIFGKALLAYGPLPGKGWTVERGRHGNVFYVKARGIEARRFQGDVIQFFVDDIRRRYAIRNWKRNHTHNVARKWKNQFFLWLWEKIDDT